MSIWSCRINKCFLWFGSKMKNTAAESCLGRELFMRVSICWASKKGARVWHRVLAALENQKEEKRENAEGSWTKEPRKTGALCERKLGRSSVQFSSVAQSCPTLRPHELQHARPPCPSPTPGVHSNSGGETCKCYCYLSRQLPTSSLNCLQFFNKIYHDHYIYIYIYFFFFFWKGQRRVWMSLPDQYGTEEIIREMRWKSLRDRSICLPTPFPWQLMGT